MAKSIISDALIDDLLIEADLALDSLDDDYLVEQRQLLRPLLNQVVKACRTPANLPAIVSKLRTQAAALGTAPAFNLFIENIADVGELSIL